MQDFIQAGNISQKVLKEIPRLVFEGQSLLDIAETIEQMIFSEGAQLGFPVNLSINDYAAHFTPAFGSEQSVGSDDLIKIDFGVSINGCVSDQATTMDMSGNNEKQVQSTRNALNSAVKKIKAGVKIGELSKAIEHEITSLGFKPISNLGGHMIKPYLLHAGVFVPNIYSPNDKNSDYEMKEGDIFAIEPFATTGKTGMVVDGDIIEIFSLKQIKNVRLKASRQIMTKIIEEYSTLPFSRRSLQKAFQSKVTVNAGLRELVRNNLLFEYPVLKDVDKGLVTQAEITCIVEQDGCTPLVPLELV